MSDSSLTTMAPQHQALLYRIAADEREAALHERLAEALRAGTSSQRAFLAAIYRLGNEDTVTPDGVIVRRQAKDIAP